MSAIINHLTGFIIGVIVSYIAIKVNEFIKKYNQKLDIEGVWLEHMPKGGDRAYSIGIIRYEKNGQYSFEGTNYKNGEPLSSWKTESINIQVKRKEIYYSFIANDVHTKHITNAGHGVLNLRLNEDNKYTLKDGWYIESKKEATSPLTHSIKRLTLDELKTKVFPSNSDSEVFSKYLKQIG